jgi:hypothetical protein
MLYLCICIHRIPIHISIFVPDLLADGLDPNAHNTIGSLEPPLGPRAASLRRRSRGALGCEARESQSAHGRGVGASQSWEGVEEARDLEALQRGRRRRRSPSGQRVAAGDDYACGRHSPPWGVILLTSHSMWSRVKTWSGSPGRMTAGLGLCNLLGDVIF